MPQIQVTIAGRSYRMACAEGEEAHLEGVAAAFESKIGELRGSFGEIGDMRLHVMAALTLADDLGESRRRIETLEQEVAALRSIASAGDERTQAVEKRLAESVAKAAERIERLARKLSAPAAASQ